jgi:hypothetical protein
MHCGVREGVDSSAGKRARALLRLDNHGRLILVLRDGRGLAGRENTEGTWPWTGRENTEGTQIAPHRLRHEKSGVAA